MRRLNLSGNRVRWVWVAIAVGALFLVPGSVRAQVPVYPGAGLGVVNPGWGFGGYYAPGPFGFAGAGYGIPVMPGPFYSAYRYPAFSNGVPAFRTFGVGYGDPAFYNPGLMNPYFGAGMTPLGVQSYIYETQVLGRRSWR